MIKLGWDPVQGSLQYDKVGLGNGDEDSKRATEKPGQCIESPNRANRVRSALYQFWSSISMALADL